jgi:hypothetical protein
MLGADIAAGDLTYPYDQGNNFRLKLFEDEDNLSG